MGGPLMNASLSDVWVALWGWSGVLEVLMPQQPSSRALEEGLKHLFGRSSLHAHFARKSYDGPLMEQPR